MTLTKKRPHCKDRTRLRPTRDEGLYIQYRLKNKGYSFVRVGKLLGITYQTVSNTTFGIRRSARIEAEIAHVLGKTDWNEVVLEARSEVQKKPVEAIIREMEQQARGRKEAALRRMAEYAAENRGRAESVIRKSGGGIGQPRKKSQGGRG